ncbi:hypothetical protein ABPG74_008210 [Tetrahymena malaccensis]
MDENHSLTVQHLINYFEYLENIIFFSMYCDILSPIYKLSKQVQKDKVNLHTLELDLKICISYLLDFNEELRCIDEIIHLKNWQVCKRKLKNFFRYNQFYLQFSNNYGFYYSKNKKNIENMIDFLIETLNEQYNYIKEIKDFLAFNISKIVNLKRNEIDTYGIKELQNMLNYYKGQKFLIDQKLVNQYQLSKRKIQSCRSSLKTNEILKLISESISQRYRTTLQAILSDTNNYCRMRENFFSSYKYSYKK